MLPQSLQDWFLPRVAALEPRPLVAPGLYHYQRKHHNEYIRCHLRVDDGGFAVLIVAASEALLLSPQGAYVAKGLLEGRSAEELQSALDVANPAQVVADVQHALADLGQPDVRYPIFNLSDPSFHEPTWRLNAPFQADLVVGSADVACRLIDKLWEARIPHVRLLATPRADKRAVVAAVTHAEDVGMIAGVRANTVRWVDFTILAELADAGLDYLMVPWGISEVIHQRMCGVGDYEALAPVVRQIARCEVTPVVNAPLLPSTWRGLDLCLDDLIQLGLEHAEVFAIAETTPGVATTSARPAVLGMNDRGFAAQQLKQVAGWVEDVADSRRIQITWLPPQRREPGERAIDVARRGPRAGGDVSIRVESDGMVVPPRGPYRIAGQLLEDAWQNIWHDDAFLRYRQRTNAPTRCDSCPGMAVCAADCPSDERSWVTA